MKRLTFAASVALSLLIFETCSAEPTGSRGYRLPSQPMGVAQFLVGFSGGLVAHELGHIAVAESMGYGYEFDGFSIVYTEDELPKGDHLRLASSGFAGQWMASETAFTLADKSGMTHTRAGVIAAHLVASLAYLTVLKDHPEGDVYGMAESAGLPRDLIAAILIVPALIDGYRLFGDKVPGWLPRVSIGWKAAALSYIWTF